MGCESSQTANLEEPHEIPRPLQLENSQDNVKKIDFLIYEKMGDQLFSEGKFLEAIEVYKKMIEAGYRVDFDI